MYEYLYIENSFGVIGKGHPLARCPLLICCGYFIPKASHLVIRQKVRLKSCCSRGRQRQLAVKDSLQKPSCRSVFERCLVDGESRRSVLQGFWFHLTASQTSFFFQNLDMKIPCALFLALLPFVTAQDAAPDPNSDFYTAPSENIDFPGCFSDLALADRNGDGVVKSNEYLGFIQEYSKRKCITNPSLTLQQRIAFNTIACGCRAEEGSSPNCCLGSNAEIRTAGALNPSRSGAQNGYLTSACRITDETLPGPQCPPADDVRDKGPIPPVIIPLAAAGGGGGLSKPALFSIIAAALLLMLLCCCCVCVFRKRRQKQLEEEENQAMAGKGLPGDLVEEQAPVGGAEPRGVPDSVALGGSPTNNEQSEVSEYDEDARKNRGGGPLGDEDEEDGRKRYGAGRLPPPETEKPGWKLRPVPPVDPEEDPDWDQPGRNIDYPKDKDDMSAGKVDHYEPDGGVYIPEREGKQSRDLNLHWERGTPQEPDEVDKRKHRIQSGLGEGEVWNQLDGDEEIDTRSKAPMGDVFDWVVQSALGVLDNNDKKP
jgi:hypothetical protein